MKTLVFTLVTLFLYCVCVGQNNENNVVLDTSNFKNWPSVAYTAISNDGKYAVYSVLNEPAGSRTMVVASMTDHWEKRILNATDNSFTFNSHFLIFKIPGDTLGILRLNNRTISFIAGINSYKLSKSVLHNLIAIKRTNDQSQLLYNPENGAEHIIPSVLTGVFTPDGNAFVFRSRIVNKIDTLERLSYLELPILKESKIMEGKKIVNLIFDRTGDRFAFLKFSSPANDSGTIFIYSRSSAKLLSLAEEKILFAPTKNILKKARIIDFAIGGNNLIISIESNNLPILKQELASLDVWSYRDKVLQAQQLGDLDASNRFPQRSVTRYLLNTETKNLTQLVKPFEAIIESERYLIVSKPLTDIDILQNRKKVDVKRAQLVSLLDGSRTQLDLPMDVSMSNVFLSPHGSFVIYYSSLYKSYFSYSTATKRINNITKGLTCDWTRYGTELPSSNELISGVAAWISNDSSVILSDQHDLWLVDLSGNTKPRQLTNGRRDNCVFRICSDTGIPSMNLNDEMLLSVFDNRTKRNTICSSKINENKKTILAAFKNYLFSLPEQMVGMLPAKAKFAHAYLVRRESANESPNYFYTSDFIAFRQVSNIHPEQKYNWVKSELIEWKRIDGKRNQAVLYKPTNFDSTLSYPVIFYFYEKMSDQLHVFKEPELSPGWINIPWFVSRGYIVCTPDVIYKIGEPGPSVLLSVESAAKYLSRFSWVDKSRFGLQGHSFGGYECNFIVTNSNLFRCAVSSAGVYDLTSAYGSVRWSGASTHLYYERSQGRLATTPWNNPEKYKRNSPLFNAGKVDAPVLLLNNKNDAAVDFSQGLSFYTSLRRQGKRAWLLQYDNEGHTLLNVKNKLDFTIRMTQFFDHYLKRAPAPRWMTEGIPAALKQVENGYELDPAGNCGKDCKVCKEWNEKYKKDSVGTTRAIRERKVNEHWQ